MPESTEALEPQEAEPQADAPKSRGLVGAVLLLLPLILVPATAGAYLAYDQYPSLARTAAAVGLHQGLEDEASDQAEVRYGQFKVLTDLLVNPAGTDGKRFLLVNIGLESQSSKVFAEVDTKDAVVRDVILRALGQRTVAELSSVTLREELKEELRTAINEVLVKGQVDRLYFTQYVLQ